MDSSLNATYWIKATTTRKSARTRVSHNFKVWLAKLIGSKHETEVVSCQLPPPRGAPTNCMLHPRHANLNATTKHRKTMTLLFTAQIPRSNQPQKQSLDERRVDCIVKSSFLSCIHRYSFKACQSGRGASLSTLLVRWLDATQIFASFGGNNNNNNKK